MSSEHPRHWKRAYDADFDENNNGLGRDDLSVPQKNWIKRAWTWASTAFLGFKQPTIPDAVPRYNEKKGWFHVPAVEPQLHHITPVGFSNRVLGEDYAQPENIAPVSASLHVGKGIRDNDEDADRVIHEDTRQAFGRFRKDPNAFKKMSEERKMATKLGKPYHNTENDDYLRDLSQQVTTGYQLTHSDDKYPQTQKEKRRGKKKKQWNYLTGEWE